MLIKCFKIGAYWDHGYRVRETMMGNNQALCPLSLLYKDHKGWSPSKGTVPSTRPVAGGHLGINLHISEIVSDLLDPVVAQYEGGRERGMMTDQSYACVRTKMGLMRRGGSWLHKGQ